MAVRLDPRRLRFPVGAAAAEPNPFLRYRELFHSYQFARAHGLPDADYVAIVRRLDAAVARVDGHGFTVTPFGRSAALSDRLGFEPAGGVWVKDETSNVSGSHKARHLMGLLIHLEVVERLGLGWGRNVSRSPLAIASCGNAALAAAVLARAGSRPLDVFIPTTADPGVVARLERLGARLTICPREDGVAGDPTYHRLQRALLDGALPFTCQGPDNGLTIEGGKTIGYEMASDLVGSGAPLDRLFIQVGGGALASSVIQGLQDAIRLGVPIPMPRIYAVQTHGAYPLQRAYDRIAERIGVNPPPAAVDDALRYASGHRSEFMWPWEGEPKSIAHGIIDDETYDWLAVVRGMLTTGGSPLVVSEETLIEANTVARTATGIDVDHTGSAGLAGLLELHRTGAVLARERAAVLFTGIRR
jgi:threonine synthase